MFPIDLKYILHSPKYFFRIFCVLFFDSVYSIFCSISALCNSNKRVKVLPNLLRTIWKYLFTKQSILFYSILFYSTISILSLYLDDKGNRLQYGVANNYQKKIYYINDYKLQISISLGILVKVLLFLRNIIFRFKMSGGVGNLFAVSSKGLVGASVSLVLCWPIVLVYEVPPLL